jgi:hypothetical protein
MRNDHDAGDVRDVNISASWSSWSSRSFRDLVGPSRASAMNKQLRIRVPPFLPFSCCPRTDDMYCLDKINCRVYATAPWTLSLTASR